MLLLRFGARVQVALPNTGASGFVGGRPGSPGRPFLLLVATNNRSRSRASGHCGRSHAGRLRRRRNPSGCSRLKKKAQAGDTSPFKSRLGKGTRAPKGGAGSFIFAVIDRPSAAPWSRPRHRWPAPAMPVWRPGADGLRPTPRSRLYRPRRRRPPAREGLVLWSRKAPLWWSRGCGPYRFACGKRLTKR